MARAGVEPAQIGRWFSAMSSTPNRATCICRRVAAMKAGVPETTPAMNVNRLCGSGAQAIVSAMQALMLGDADVALAGGAECMSRVALCADRRALGAEDGRHQGAGHDDRRADLPVWHRPYGGDGGKRGRRAWHHPRRSGRLRAGKPDPRGAGDCRGPVRRARSRRSRLPAARGRSALRWTNTPRPPRPRRWPGLRPAFQKDGTVTAGNASGINDGAAALVLARGDAAARG